MSPFSPPPLHSERLLLQTLQGRSVTHHSIDEVNVDTLQRLLGKRGLRTDHQEPRDGLDSGSAVVIDADSWWLTPGDRQQGVDQLLQRIVRPALLVIYGWQLTDEQRQRLELAGALVFSSPDQDLASALAALDDRFVGSAPVGWPAWKPDA